MKTIFAEDAEKYSQLICEAKLKTDEISSIEGMLNNPETIAVVNFAFADVQSKTAHGGFCYGPHIVIEDGAERIECLTFFASILKKQLEEINQQIEELQSKTGV